MFTKSLQVTSLYTRVPLTVAILLFSIPSQALLPTPLDTANLNVVTSTPIDTISTNHTQALADNTQNVQNAGAEQLLANWRVQAKSKNLAQHTTWRRLLYFIDDKKGLFNKGKTKSLVEDSDFFLSTSGYQDSAAELDATLAALANEIMQPASAQANNSNSVQCRFPARVQWLSEHLAIDQSDLQTNCPELDEWMSMLNPEQLSIMFGEEYLDNPISAFAHTLLRIDSPASVADPSQIHYAYAFNDTVDGNPDDPFVVYAIKSMIGSYDNIIEIDPYPEKLAKYLKEDERDTWTYQLDLTPSEVRQMMLHVWETKDLYIPYYFATDNCASEILRLIDVVRPEQYLLGQLPYVVIPSDVINLLADEQLLAGTVYTPSDATVRQAQLNKAEEASELGYATLTEEEAYNIKSADINLASSISKDMQRLEPPLITPSDNNPLDRHPLQRGHVGIGQSGDNSYIELGLRAGYHSTLDRPAGFRQFFDLEGVSATWRLYNTDDDNDNNQPSSVELQNFTLVRGRSFNPVNSAEKGDTWGASIEATRVNDGSQEEGGAHLVGSTAFEYGKSWAFGEPKANSGEMPPQLCYTFATGAAQAGRGINNGFRVGAGVNAGCLYQINNQLRAQAELQLPYWYHGSSSEDDIKSHYWQPITTLGLQYDIDKKQALRINASYEWQDRVDANEDIKLSYMRYF
ncbi:DUF4105 domain-containing protein [uncultured Psychrobacter sp.]|uniref:Lnb N-terminal periplasmic domain-containing protein n=1 Tax=uncultured Psychrobacter sp. TaxID=259303 RepID=UPI003459A9CE